MDKNSNNPPQDEIMMRSCAICNAEIMVHRLPSRRYKGGNYFGRIGAGKEKFEYWECDRCFKARPFLMVTIIFESHTTFDNEQHLVSGLWTYYLD